MTVFANRRSACVVALFALALPWGAMAQLSSPVAGASGVPAGTGAGVHSPNSPFAPLQERSDVVPWPLLTEVKTRVEKNRILPVFSTPVMALNALGVARPATPLYPDFGFFTQQGFFDGIHPRVASAEGVAKEGMTLEQLGAALGHFALRVEVISGAALDVHQLRQLLKQHLRQSDRFVLLNFNRRFIGQLGGGHWSPLAAYHEASDSALLLDVARYKYPAVWVPLAQLLAAAQDPDSVSAKARGLLVVSKPAP